MQDFGCKVDRFSVQRSCTKGEICSFCIPHMRQGTMPSGRARCRAGAGCSATKYQSLPRSGFTDQGVGCRASGAALRGLSFSVEGEIFFRGRVRGFSGLGLGFVV